MPGDGLLCAPRGGGVGHKGGPSPCVGVGGVDPSPLHTHTHTHRDLGLGRKWSEGSYVTTVVPRSGDSCPGVPITPPRGP